MLKGIEVRGLYGAFNHPITLKDENISLILGENGLGKTLILKMINAFYCRDFYELYSFQYKVFRLIFSDGVVLTIEKQINAKNEELIITKSTIDSNKKKSKEDTHSIPIFDGRRMRNLRNRRFFDIEDEIYYILRTYLPYPIERISRERWYDPQKGISFTTNEIVNIYKNVLPSDILEKVGQEMPKWLIEKIDSADTIFIETQRLLIKSDEKEYRASVTKYSQELVEIIKNTTVKATDLASKLDKSYPNRVINQITQNSQITDSEINEGLESLSKKRTLLNNVGLIDTNEEEDINPSLTKQTENNNLLKDVLRVYIEDSNEKLTVYDDLSEKLELLINIINKRFLYKKLSIDKKEGFIFKSTITEKEIPLSGLSSGEQHELVLFYQLLFNTKPNSLLLIDEPEISLHVTWQNHFIDDLREVIKLNNFSAIIATHSPDIINKNWDLTIALKGI